MSEDLLQTLKKQHQELKGILTGIKNKAGARQPDGVDILKRLLTFKKGLKKHLDLENNSFYPKLLEKMRQRQLATENTEIFIGEMKALEQEIMDFLGQYDEAKKIESRVERFRPELDFIISSVMLRVTSEEDGVFLYW